MTARASIRRAVDAVLGNTVVTAAVSRQQEGLRVLAYHGVGNPDTFRRQMGEVATRFHPVTASEVAAWCRGGDLPSRSVWVTFDDGYPSVVEVAAPIMTALGISATAFVCPSVVDSERPLWWQVVEGALGGEPDVAAEFKHMPDDERRRRITALEDSTPTPISATQISSTQLRTWRRQGHTIGNHSWDHPLLDRCDPAQQVRQVREAHDFLVPFVEDQPLLFAYPNGNWARGAEEELERLGYDVAVLFDHAIARHGQNRLRISRLRADADSDLLRFRAILSGAHSVTTRIRAAVGGAGR